MMRIIKLICLLLLLNSCNKYLGVVDPDYTPSDELEDVFSNELTKSNENEISEIKKIIYPLNQLLIGDVSSIEVKKITSLEESSYVYFDEDILYFTKKDELIIQNLNDSKEELKFELNLDKEEKIIQIFEYSKEIFILSNKSKLFLFINGEISQVANFDKFINDEIIQRDDKLLIFSVFGDLNEINLNQFTESFKGKFTINHGVSINSRNYEYENQISHLYNSGTLIFLNQNNFDIEENYYLDDLNILSSLGYFEDFLESPFGFKDYLYFIDRSGLISVFNPLISEFLWEVNINSIIKDFNFSEDGKLLLLTNNDILIFDYDGTLLNTIEHNNEAPLKLISEKDKILVVDEKGIEILDIKTGSQINFIKNKFDGVVEYLSSNSKIYIKDNKYLYKLSE